MLWRGVPEVPAAWLQRPPRFGAFDLAFYCLFLHLAAFWPARPHTDHASFSRFTGISCFWPPSGLQMSLSRSPQSAPGRPNGLNRHFER